MALILTVIETRKGVIAKESLGALAVGRRVASSRGATLYAVLLLPAYDQMQQDLVVQLSAYRADRVILVTQAAEPFCAETWIPALKEVIGRFHPTFLLFGATRLAEELAPPLCVHLRGVYIPDGSIVTTPQLKVDWFHPRSQSITEFFEEDMESAFVVMVRSGVPDAPAPAAEIEVIPLQAPVSPGVEICEVSRRESAWGEDVCVVLGSLALHRADELARWCQLQEWPLVRLGQAPAGAIPWWQAEPAGSGLLLVGCTEEEFALCEEIFSMFSRWVCMGSRVVPTGNLRGEVQVVSGDLDAVLDALFQKEL